MTRTNYVSRLVSVGLTGLLAVTLLVMAVTNASGPFSG